MTEKVSTIDVRQRIGDLLNRVALRQDEFIIERRERRWPPWSPWNASKALADHRDCDVKVINRIVNGRTSVSAEMALKLAAAFRTSAEFWLNAQKAVDLFQAERRLSKLPAPVLRAS